MNPLELQRTVTQIALKASGPRDFALAGSGAIREHGVISRLSEDVDLFTSNVDEGAFGIAVDRVIDALTAEEYEVITSRRTQQFARLHVRTAKGEQVDIDMGMDWREAEPVTMEIGPVLSIQDAIGNKVAALYSRAEARDFFDVDAIRASSHYSDNELIAAAIERDPGFEIPRFASQLRRVDRLTHDDLREYGVTNAELSNIKTRITNWANDIDPS
jgi:hypothetical protein